MRIVFHRRTEPYSTPDRKSAKCSTKPTIEPSPMTSTCTTGEDIRISTAATPKPRPKGTKVASLIIAMDSNKNDCWITGIAVDKQGKKLLADKNNKKVKLFSREMKSLYCISVLGEPWDIVMIGENEAAVTCGHWLVIIQVSDKQLRIKSKNKMPFEMGGICQYKDKLIITVPHSEPHCAQLANQTGKIDWSESSDKGNALFISPLYVSSFVHLWW